MEVKNLKYYYKLDDSKRFAKKENAEEYIKQNKKIYSLNDIKEAVKNLDCFDSTLIEYLESSVS